MSNLLNNSLNFLKKNSPTILTIIGGVGVIATSVMAVKATPKALEKLKIAKEEKGEELTKVEKIKTAGPVYIPAVVTGASTLACMFGANVLNKRYQASLISAYALIDTSFKEYKDKLKELYGEETHQTIVDAIAVEKAENTYVRGSYMVSECDQLLDGVTSEPVLFYEEYGNRYFEATIEQVLNAEYHLNRNYILRGYSNLNELYDFLGLEPTDYGSTVGWTPTDEGEYWIEFNHRKVILDDGLECYILEMPFEPSTEYGGYSYY